MSLPCVNTYTPSEKDVATLFSQWQWYADRIEEGGRTYMYWANVAARRFEEVTGYSIDNYLEMKGML